MLVRDLSTTLLFLVVFLKSHSEELRAAGRRGNVEDGEGDSCALMREDVSRHVNALFVALADIFHCWFSSPVSSSWNKGFTYMHVCMYIKAFVHIVCNISRI